MFGKPEAVADTSEEKGFSFSGTAKEYFGIWIVNLLLSIITIGIYTAWAKVRRLRYFYGNTWLDGHNFEYHAKPIQILIGRIIVVAVLIVVNVISNFFPLFAFLILIPYMIALPWLLNKAISFNARMTSYRNVHFNFEGSYGSAFWVFVVLPLLVPIGVLVLGALMYFSASNGLAGARSSALMFQNVFSIIVLVIVFVVAQIAIIPYISKKVNEYIGNNTRYGSARFATDLELSALYKNLGILVLCAGVPIVVIAGIAYSAVQFGATNLALGSGQFVIFIIYAVLIGGAVFYAAGVRNIAYNGTTLDGVHKLKSSLSRLTYTIIIITNFLAIIVSIGLLRPWTAVRTWRYLADNTALEIHGSMDGFIAGQEESGNVVAGEYLDIEGIDFGL